MKFIRIAISLFIMTVILVTGNGLFSFHCLCHELGVDTKNAVCSAPVETEANCSENCSCETINSCCADTHKAGHPRHACQHEVEYYKLPVFADSLNKIQIKNLMAVVQAPPLLNETPNSGQDLFQTKIYDPPERTPKAFLTLYSSLLL